MKIVTFGSTAEGVAAFKSFISSSGHGYPGIVSAFNFGHDAPTIIKAINNSGWVTGRPGSYVYWNKTHTAKFNGLAQTYNSIGGGDVSTAIVTGPAQLPPLKSNGQPLIIIPSNRISDVNVCPTGYSRATYDPGLDPVGAISHLLGGGIVDIHSLKSGEANVCLAAGFGVGNLALQEVSKGAGDVAGATALPALNIFGSLAGKAVGIGAIILGAGIVIFGAYLVSKDVYSGGGGGMLDVTPIIVRE
jgi:hypothetical protein